MDENHEELLWGQLGAISDETDQALGERAYCFIDLFSDWTEILGALRRSYPEAVLVNSLVATDLCILAKELHWLHRLLHWGNYPLVFRTLRYDWELMLRAYYADVYQPSVPGDQDVPPPSTDDKLEWLEGRGPSLNSGSLLSPILNALLPPEERGRFKRLWGTLNRHVHPTSELRYRLIGASALAVGDSFDKAWAEEAVGAAANVFDLIWLSVLSRFPECIPLVGPLKLVPLSSHRCNHSTLT